MGRFEFDIHDVQIRPMEVSDLDTVMHIEESVFVFPWQRGDSRLKSSAMSLHVILLLPFMGG